MEIDDRVYALLQKQMTDLTGKLESLGKEITALTTKLEVHVALHRQDEKRAAISGRRYWEIARGFLSPAALVAAVYAVWKLHFGG